MQSKILIGVAGTLHHGKGEVGNYLRESVGYTEVRIADPMRRFIAEMLGIPFADLLDQGETKEKFRPVMQYVGTEVIREELPKALPGLWPETAHAKCLCRKLRENPGVYVVTDVRFEDEVEELRRLKEDGWVVQFWLVRRPNLESDLSEEVLSHVSESFAADPASISTFDAVLDNDGTLEDLQVKVEENLILLDSALRIQALREKRKAGEPVAPATARPTDLPDYMAPIRDTIYQEADTWRKNAEPLQAWLSENSVHQAQAPFAPLEDQLPMRETLATPAQPQPNRRQNPKTAQELFPTSYTPPKSERREEPKIRSGRRNETQNGVTTGNRHPNYKGPVRNPAPAPQAEEGVPSGPTDSRFHSYVVGQD